MAGNKISTKTKGKDDKSKTNKVQSNEDNEDADFSILRKPIHTSITGFAQARKIYDLATEELKRLISNECDLLYECKVCRNIFRSLANFISHKRVYCKEEFNSSLHGHFFKIASASNELLKIKRLEESYFESLKNKNEVKTVNTDELDNRIPLTKDLSTIIEKIVINKGVSDNSQDPELILQKIPNSNVAVFQNYDNTVEKVDRMRNQVNELDTLLSQDKAILQSDGKFKIQSSLPCDSDNVIQISDDDDDDNNDNDSTVNLKCKICGQIFSTQKTLKFHMKYKHLESRLVYPCPDCLEIFSTSWSVYRHLFKVHRKTAAQIRRLRESIQSKAFKMNNPPAFYEKRKNVKTTSNQKISEEERLDQENQAWMDNVEGDGDIPRCFGCGRTFERRAALAAHTHTCQPRSRALARRPQETKKIEIQIRKDYNKGPVVNLNLPLKNTDSNENKISSEEISSSKIAKEIDLKETKKNGDEEEAVIVEETPMDVTEISNENDKSPDKPKENLNTCPENAKDILPLNNTPMKLRFSQHIENNNMTAFRIKIKSDIEINKLLCRKCDVQHNTVHELYHHMADHYKWMRYACKLCNFKHYDFERLPEHVKIVHKLKGDSDFYCSTVKAMDGKEALEMSESISETAEINDTSPDSRRPSRCSSDSSRLSDDSSSSSTRVESNIRKRKASQNKSFSKKKKESFINDDDEDLKTVDEKDTTDDASSLSRTFEENSSDMDDIEDKISKRSSNDILMTVAARRPVRKKTKIKNEDFEYDLSNLLKMEAQGYRDSQSVAPKANQSKKKTNQDNYYEIVNKDCNGALATLSMMSVEGAGAHYKNMNFILSNSPQKETKTSNIFVRPMLPKTVCKVEKNLPKKEVSEESVDNQKSQNKINDKTTSENIPKVTNAVNSEDAYTHDLEKGNQSSEKSEPEQSNQLVSSVSTPSISIPAVLPIKFRRESLDVIKKSTLINKKITDFKKAGMKTKILVIKPIHRNKDNPTTSNTPLKFQTIKLKDPNCSSKEESVSDQVVLVKVPKVDCVSQRLIPDSNISQTVTATKTINIDKTPADINSDSNTLNNNVSSDAVCSDEIKNASSITTSENGVDTFLSSLKTN